MRGLTSVLLGVALLVTSACEMVDRPDGRPHGDGVAKGVPAMRLLTVREGMGSLNVIGEDGGERIEAIAEVRSGTSKDAEATFPIEVKEATSAQPRIDIPDPGLAAGKKLFVTIRMPAKMKLDLAGHRGDLRISGLRSGLTLTNESGKIVIQDVHQRVLVTNSSESCEISEIQGDIVVTDKVGSLTITAVTGNVEIHDGGGPLNVFTITGDVAASGNDGNPSFMNIEGDLTLRGISHDNARVNGVTGSVIYPSGYSGE